MTILALTGAHACMQNLGSIALSMLGLVCCHALCAPLFSSNACNSDHHAVLGFKGGPSSWTCPHTGPALAKEVLACMQAGHAVHEDEADKTAEVIAKFLQRFKIGQPLPLGIRLLK